MNYSSKLTNTTNVTRSISLHSTILVNVLRHEIT